MEKASDQRPTVARLALHATKEVEGLGPANCHALISCSKSKGDHRDLARNIYVSPLYRKSVMVADGWGVSFSILSAKYGLLDPDQTIEPYDLTLKGASKEFKHEWANKVDKQIRNSIQRNKHLIVLAGDYTMLRWSKPVGTILLTLSAPMRGLSLGNSWAFLIKAFASTSAALRLLVPMVCLTILRRAWASTGCATSLRKSSRNRGYTSFLTITNQRHFPISFHV